MNDDIEIATHYSKSRDEYFYFDNACFVYSNEHGWVEYTAIGKIEDLQEI